MLFFMLHETSENVETKKKTVEKVMHLQTTPSRICIVQVFGYNKQGIGY
jgi:hypothetical protein